MEIFDYGGYHHVADGVRIIDSNPTKNDSKQTATNQKVTSESRSYSAFDFNINHRVAAGLRVTDSGEQCHLYEMALFYTPAEEFHCSSAISVVSEVA